MRLVTQKAIADTLGLSQSTVKAVFNPDPRIRLRPETCDLVVQTARRLGYRPHHYARVMRKGKSRTIAMLQMGGLLHVNDMRALHVARAVHGQGFRFSTHHVLWHVEGVQDALDAVLDARAEGLILVGPTERVPSTFLKQIRDAQIALVSVSGVHYPGVPQVRSDFHQCVSELTNHLLGLGYRRIALLTGWASLCRDEHYGWTTQEKINGFQEAIAESGSDQISGEVVCIEEDKAVLDGGYVMNGKAEMQKLLQRPNRPEAVICSNDSWVLGALAACAEAGVRVPQEIALTGIDNDPIGEIIQPPLTTSAQPTEAIANRAVEILMKQVRGEKLSTSEMLVKLPCQLVVRQSCGAQK